MSEEIASKEKSLKARLGEVWKTTRTIPRVMRLVWDAHPLLFSVFFFVQFIMGLVPLSSVWVIKTLVDSIPTQVSFGPEALQWPPNVSLALLVLAGSWFMKEVSEPISDYCREQINENMTRNINLMMMDKVNSIVDIAILENPKFYDKLQRVRWFSAETNEAQKIASASQFVSGFTFRCWNCSELCVCSKPGIHWTHFNWEHGHVSGLDWAN